MDLVLTKSAMDGLRLLFREPRRLSVACGRHTLVIQPGTVCRFDRQPTNGLHRHPYFELCLVLGGRGEFIHGDRTFALGAGDVFLSEPEVDHEIRSPRTRDLELVFFSFEIATARVLAADAGDEEPCASFLRGRRAWAATSGLLRRHAAWLPADAVAASGPALLDRRRECLFLELLEIVSERSSAAAPASPAAGPDPLQRASDYINGHLHLPLSVSSLAVEAGISARQLRRLFRERLGTTVVDEINRRKMNAAAHHLLMRFPVTEVAYLCGIDHPSHFTRAFKRAVGVSPREFQKRYTPLGQLPRTTRRENSRPPRAPGPSARAGRG
jgi:AraC-like DNA-binding protein